MIVTLRSCSAILDGPKELNPQAIAEHRKRKSIKPEEILGKLWD